MPEAGQPAEPAVSDRAARVRIRPLRWSVLIAGTLFVLVGTVLMAVHGRWWGAASGISGMLILAGAWSADLRPPLSRNRRGGPARSERARRRSMWMLIAALMILAGCTFAGLIIGNPTISFFGATLLVSQGLTLTGPLYSGRPPPARR